MSITISAQWEEMAAQLDELAQVPADAAALVESLAAAVFPPEARALETLTWADPAVSNGPSRARAQSAHAPAQTLEERLHAAELRFRTLVEQIPAVTFMAVLGEGTNEVYVSPHIERLLGYSQEEWLADPFLWYRRLHVPDRVLWNNEFARGCRTGGPFRAECRFIARDGHTVWVHGEAHIAKDERGRPMFLQGVAFDITESKRAQEVLLADAVRTARAQEELEIARRVQTSIIPRTFDVPGLEIAAAMFPAEDVGGDYYDVLPANEGAWIAVGDVSGHGLNSGLVMLMVQSAVSAVTRANPDATPREVLCLVNGILYDNIRKRLMTDDHVTFTLIRYRPDGRLVFAGAHEDLLIWRARTGVVERIEPPGTWLGARPDIAYATVDSSVRLEHGDVVVLYTDGITEAMDARRRQFELDRLCKIIEEKGLEPVETIRDAIIDGVREWMAVQYDDMSVLVARHFRH
jgi:PAS domain S-box-containing protein